MWLAVFYLNPLPRRILFGRTEGVLREPLSDLEYKRKGNRKVELNTESVVNILRNEYDAWIAMLSEKEKFAIEKYSWNSFDKSNGRISFFQRLNSMLRGINTEEKEMLEEYADIISNAVSKHPIEHAVVCYRGSDYDMTDGSPVGGSFLSTQFISTSVIRSKKLPGQYEFVIHIPEGANVAYIEKLSKYKKQRELLINRNTVFTVISRNGFLVELEVLL